MVTTNGFAAPWVEFEKSIGARPLIHGPTIEDCFAEWAGLGGLLVSKLTFPAPDLSVKTEERKLSCGVNVRIYTPEGYQPGSSTAGLYIHGGGWAMGDLETDDPDCRAFAKQAGVVLVSVNYRLAPQHKYPAGLDDCFEAFNWTLDNAEAIGGEPGKTFIIGASAGGGSSFGLALKLIDAGKGFSIAGVVSQVPVIVHPNDVPSHLKSQYTSYDENAENTVNSHSAMLAFWDAYGAPAKDKYANPLLHDRLSQLPKVYMTCCDQDTLRDDARLMKDALQSAGVKLQYDEFKGYPHYFWTFPTPGLKEAAQDYRQKVVNGIKFVLS